MSSSTTRQRGRFGRRVLMLLAILWGAALSLPGQCRVVLLRISSDHGRLAPRPVANLNAPPTSSPPSQPRASEPSTSPGVSRLSLMASF